MEGWTRVVIGSLVLFSLPGLLAACAEWSEPTTGSLAVMPSSLSLTGRLDERAAVNSSGQRDYGTASASDPRTEAAGPAAARTPVMVAAANPADANALPEQGTQEERSVDDFYDPFQKPGEQPEQIEEYDPWEPFNVAIFNFNRKVDEYLLKPVATAYDTVMPDEIELGIRRVFHNIRFGPRFLNNLFQGKFKGAGVEMGRFLINSTLGLGGYLDFAKEVFHLDTPDEDFGQTLGKYGAKPGRFLVLPIPPFVTTVRDLVGYVVDIFLDPTNYFLIPSFQLDGAPSAISHSDRAAITASQFGSRSLDVINERSINLESYEGVEQSTVDLYATVRNAYLQRRAQAIRE